MTFDEEYTIDDGNHFLHGWASVDGVGAVGAAAAAAAELEESMDEK